MSKISILIPFKNAETWLKETIESIQSQDCEWELICIDDHSTDQGLSLIHDFNDERIQTVSNTGSGIVDALCTGFTLVTGDLITRMDADDVMPKGRLSLMANTLSNAPRKTIVTGKVRYFADGELSDGFASYESWMNERIEEKDFFKHIYRECTVASPNWMGFTEDFKEYNFFEQLNYPEDYDLLFRWYKNDFNIIGLNETTLLWRDHPSRTSKNSETYNQRALFELKLDWFNGLNPGKSIAILGAGTKGKIAADVLLTQGREVKWYDLNHTSFNTPVMGMEVNNYENINEDLLLVAIFPKERKELERFITSKGYVIGETAWYL